MKENRALNKILTALVLLIVVVSIIASMSWKGNNEKGKDDLNSEQGKDNKEASIDNNDTTVEDEIQSIINKINNSSANEDQMAVVKEEFLMLTTIAYKKDFGDLFDALVNTVNSVGRIRISSVEKYYDSQGKNKAIVIYYSVKSDDFMLIIYLNTVGKMKGYKNLIGE